MINLFLPGKKTIILVCGLGIFILVLALASIVSNPSPVQSPLPTPRPTSQPLNNLPLGSESPNSFSKIYQEGSVEKNYERIIGRKPLSVNEQSIKSKLLQLSGGESGIIYQSETFTVEYLKSADYFMVRLNTPQITQTKKGVTAWFLEQGFSQEGVCNLPVVLYLTSDVRDYLLQNNLTFDPVPEGCE